MKHVARSTTLAVAALLLAGSVSRSVRAEPTSASAGASKEVCASAFERTQELRAASQLLEAREQAVRCSSEQCPAMLAKPCLQWLQEITSETPSLVVVVQDPAGRDVPSEVRIDGKSAPEAAAGKPIALNPGSHRVEISVAGGLVAETVVLRVGEKLRRVVLRAAPEPAAASDDGIKTAAAGWISLAFGGAGLVMGAVAGGLALSEKASLDEACPTPTSCPAERAADIDSMDAAAHVSTAGFAIGGIGLALGTVLLLIDDDAGGAAEAMRRGELVLRF